MHKPDKSILDPSLCQGKDHPRFKSEIPANLQPLWGLVEGGLILDTRDSQCPLRCSLLIQSQWAAAGTNIMPTIYGFHK